MARYKGPTCRLCRRENLKLYLKSDRCYSNKCALDRRSTVPGQHGQGRKKFTEYGLQLRAKQTVKRIYGIFEKQFRGYFKEADRQKGITGDNLLILLERRLDNVIFRLGLALTRSQSRQMIRHGHFLLNNKKINIPSYLVKQNDKITVREKNKKNNIFKELKELDSIPKWLEVNLKELTGNINSLPIREDIMIPVNQQLIVELYSR